MTETVRSNFGAVKAIVLDIEGTTTSISFVKDVLFPFSIDNVRAFVRAEWLNPEVQMLISQLRTEASTEEGVPKIPVDDDEDSVRDGVHECVKRLVTLDRKLTSLKELQGRIWRKGYEMGVLTGHIFDDVPKSMSRWRERGHRIYIYSSGSEDAQKLLFRFSDFGDLLPLIDGHFDTRIGHKRDPESYKRILEKIQEPPEKVLFLTDVQEEALAAKEAGMHVGILKRPGNAPIFAKDLPVFDSFNGILKED